VVLTPRTIPEEDRLVHDQNLLNAARALSVAIGRRWDGWYAVNVGVDEGGSGSIRVSFDRDHRPALAVSASYNGYPVHLRPAPLPAGTPPT
jgi:hypothetical protein